MSKTTISVSKDTREELKILGKKNEDYDTIIKKCINFTKKFENELQFHEWFKKNYELVGFDAIKEERTTSGCPDFIMLRGDKEIKVELETLSSNFILHKHDPKNVDLVICLIKNRELPVKTVEITPFEFNTRTTIQISSDLRDKLKILAAVKDTSYEGLLEELAKEEINKMKLNNIVKKITHSRKKKAKRRNKK